MATCCPPATSVCRSQMLCGEFVVETHSFVRSPTGAHLSLVPIMSMELPAIVVLIVPVRPPGQYCSRVHNVLDAAAQAVFAEFHVFAPLGKAIHVGTTAQTCGTQRRKTSDRFSVGMAPVPERGPKKLIDRRRRGAVHAKVRRIYRCELLKLDQSGRRR